MSSAKGFPTSDKIVALSQTGTKNEYNTLQPTGSKRVSLDTVVRGVTLVTAGLIVAAGSGNVPGGVPQIITTVPNVAEEGNVIRFTSGVMNNQEVAATKVINNTTFEVGMYLPSGIVGATFDLFSYVTPLYAADGSISVSIPAPLGGATEAKQDVQIADFEAARPEYNAVLPAYTDGDKVDLQTDINGQLLVVDTLGATELQTLNADGAKEAKQDTQITELQTLNTNVSTAANQATMITELQTLNADVATAANQATIIAELQTLNTNSSPDIILTSNLDYATTNITTAGWTELVADTGATAITQIQIFDSSGYTIEFGLGGVGAEVLKLLINPGGNGLIPVNIPANSRISLRSLSQPTINVGESVINYMG